MKKTVVYRRCSVTFNLSTIERCKELAAEKGQSVSSLLRLLVAEEAAAKKREPSRGTC